MMSPIDDRFSNYLESDEYTPDYLLKYKKPLFKPQQLVVFVLLVSALILWGIIAVDYKKGHFKVAESRELPDYLIVAILDVGQGDAIFIRTPDHKNILIDAGERGTEYSPFDGGKMVVLPFLRKHNICALCSSR